MRPSQPSADVVARSAPSSNRQDQRPASAAVARSSSLHSRRCRLNPGLHLSVIARSKRRSNPPHATGSLGGASGLRVENISGFTRNEIRTRDLEAAGRHQGCPGAPVDAVVLRLALRRAVGAAGPGDRWSARARPRRNGRRAAGPGRAVGARRGRQPNEAIPPARPRCGARRGREDDRVKAVALDLEGFIGGGQTAMSDLADALRRVRSAGKPVIAYSVGYGDDHYQLAAASSEVWLHPLGIVAIAGPGGSNPYFKGLLDKLGVTANVYRVGTYKSAVEPFIRTDMSPESRENYQAFGDALLESWREDPARRPRPSSTSSADHAAVVAAAAAISLSPPSRRMVDKIADRRAFAERLPARRRDETIRRSTGQADSTASGRVTPRDDRVVTVAHIVDGKAPAVPPPTASPRRRERASDGASRICRRATARRFGDAPNEFARRCSPPRPRSCGGCVDGNVAASGGYWVARSGYIGASRRDHRLDRVSGLPASGSLEKRGCGRRNRRPLSAARPDQGPRPRSPADPVSVESGTAFPRDRLASRASRRAAIDRIARAGCGTAAPPSARTVDGFVMEEAIAKAASSPRRQGQRGSATSAAAEIHRQPARHLATTSSTTAPLQGAFATIVGCGDERTAAIVDCARPCRAPRSRRAPRSGTVARPRQSNDKACCFARGMV